MLSESNSVSSRAPSTFFLLLFLVASSLEVTSLIFLTWPTYSLWASSDSIFLTIAAWSSKKRPNESNSLAKVGTAVKSLSMVTILRWVSPSQSASTSAGGGMQTFTESLFWRASSADFLTEWNSLSKPFLAPSADFISPTADLRERTSSTWSPLSSLSSRCCLSTERRSRSRSPRISLMSLWSISSRSSNVSFLAPLLIPLHPLDDSCCASVWSCERRMTYPLRLRGCWPP